MAEDGDGRRPYGPGSEGPLADPAEMPPCHPIKGHLASMTYHRPDSVAYAALVPGVWFVSPSAAESAGFELAKAHPEPGATEDFEPGGARHPCTTEAVAALLGAAPPPQPVAPPTLESATGAEPLDVESIFEQWIELVEDPDEDDDDLVAASVAGPLQLETDPDPTERLDAARSSRWPDVLLALVLVVSVAALIWNNDGEDGGEEVAERNTTTEMTPPAEVEAGSSPPPLATEGSAEPAPVPTVTPRPTEVPGAAAGPEATATPELLSTCSTLLSTLDAKAYDEVALAIERSGVLEASNAVALTLFAPADDGFAALPMGVRAALERDTRVTTDLVRYHVTEAALPAEALRSGPLETLQPDPLVVRTDLGGLTVNHAGVVEADVQGGDCVVHGIDAVLVPPRLMRAVGILSLDAAVGSAPVDFDALDELTPTGRRTAEAVCAYVTGVERFLGIPALRRTAGDSEASDRRREEAVTAALTDCGADRVVVEAVTPPSVDG